jgi:ribosomal protein S6
MGKRKLAYEVRGERKGIYFIHYLEGDGTTVAEAERHCRLDETIMKFMTVKQTKLRPIKGKPHVRREGEED